VPKKNGVTTVPGRPPVVPPLLAPPEEAPELLLPLEVPVVPTEPPEELPLEELPEDELDPLLIPVLDVPLPPVAPVDPPEEPLARLDPPDVPPPTPVEPCEAAEVTELPVVSLDPASPAVPPVLEDEPGPEAEQAAPPRVKAAPMTKRSKVEWLTTAGSPLARSDSARLLHKRFGCGAPSIRLQSPTAFYGAA
jgi:hypothetical protein